ncbi:MAG TPA: adenylate/guanylate cyclase domain-containing protein, partial [Afifellaceae bacterium]|nr:adenylate/guanylate cyclase domain-containing protein [Afifellaceae bacterium]
MLKRWLSESIAVGVVTAFVVSLLCLTPLVFRIENQYGLGLLYYLRGPVEPPEGAIIIAVDPKTIAWVRDIVDDRTDGAGETACIPERAHRDLSNIRGPGSLPRSVHGCLIGQLSAVGFPVIVFDILFSMEGIAEDDILLARAIEKHGATAILVGLERSIVRDGESELVVERNVRPIASLAEIAAGTGTFVVPRSGGPVYGYWRNVPGFENINTLPDEAFRLFRAASNDVAEREEGHRDFEYLWLYGPPGSVPIVSASDVLSNQIPNRVRDAASGSVAFVGASDPTLTNFPDTFPSFFRGPSVAGISGVELASTAFLNQKHGEVLRQLSPLVHFLTIFLFAAFAGFIARARSGLAIFGVPVAAALYLAAATFVFSHMHMFLPIAGPVFIAAPAAFLLAIFIRYRLARALLMRIAPAQMARRMMIRETGHRSEVVSDDATVVFFDLIGSTGIAENIPPLDFSALLNTYHDMVTKFVERRHGQIIAFSGDGVMAAFTRIDAGADHASFACHAAKETVLGFREINASNEKSGIPPLHMRIGINSGNVAEGEIGARDRFNFSVVGDVVNLASRLEQLGKTVLPDQTDA